jgi:hypothetical protein
MLQRVLVGLVMLIMLVMLTPSCSKRSGIMDQNEIIKGFAPHPMALDSLELDSLTKAGFK